MRVLKALRKIKLAKSPASLVFLVMLIVIMSSSDGRRMVVGICQLASVAGPAS